jgi:hypothetical protein
MNATESGKACRNEYTLEGRKKRCTTSLCHVQCVLIVLQNSFVVRVKRLFVQNEMISKSNQIKIKSTILNYMQLGLFSCIHKLNCSIAD